MLLLIYYLGVAFTVGLFTKTAIDGGFEDLGSHPICDILWLAFFAAVWPLLALAGSFYFAHSLYEDWKFKRACKKCVDSHKDS